MITRSPTRTRFTIVCSLPWSDAEHPVKVLPSYMVHARCQPVQRDPPPVDKREGEEPAAGQDLPDPLLVVVGYAVARRVERPQLPAPPGGTTRVLPIQF